MNKVIQLTATAIAISLFAPVYAADVGGDMFTPAASAPTASDPSMPTLRGSAAAGSSSADNNVESFFQINPIVRNSSQNVLMQPPVVTTTGQQKKSISHYVFKGFWHILDFAGVPLPIGQSAYIDPSLNSTYQIPCPKLPRTKDVEKGLEKSGIGVPTSPPSSSISPELNPQKIPETELEGVPLPAPRDDVHESAP